MCVCVLPRPDVLVCSINHDCIAPVLDNTKRARSVSTLGQRVIIFVTNRRLRRVNLRARVYDFVTADRNGKRQRTRRAASRSTAANSSVHHPRSGSRRGIPTLIIAPPLTSITSRCETSDRSIALMRVPGRPRLSERRGSFIIRIWSFCLAAWVSYDCGILMAHCSTSADTAHIGFSSVQKIPWGLIGILSLAWIENSLGSN